MKKVFIIKYLIFFFGQMAYSHICVIWVDDVENKKVISIIISDFILSAISFYTIKEISDSGKWYDFLIYSTGSVIGCITGLKYI